MTDLHQRCELIRERLQRVQLQPHEKVHPPLTEEQVFELEAEFGGSFPDEFHIFLLEVSAGGLFFSPPPRYGSDRSWWGQCWYDTPEEWKRCYESPCLLHPGMTVDWLKELFGDDWEERDEAGETLCPYAGTLSIVYQGGCADDCLILNGPYRGRICWIDGEFYEGYKGEIPVFAPEANFLDWYEAKLEKRLATPDEAKTGMRNSSSIYKADTSH